MWPCRSCGALRFADLGDVGSGLAEVDVEVGALRRGWGTRRGPAGPRRWPCDAADALDPAAEALAGLALVGEAAHDPDGGLGGVAWPAGAGPSGRSASAPGRRSRRAASGSRGPAWPWARRSAPKKPMSAMWCWPHELVQPEMLVRTPPTSARPASSSAAPMASARPRDWVTARLQVSAPGQATTSRASSAPGSAMPMASSRANSVGQLRLGQAAEDDVLPVGDADVERRARAVIEASARNWSVVMSPSRA